MASRWVIRFLTDGAAVHVAINDASPHRILTDTARREEGESRCLPRGSIGLLCRPRQHGRTGALLHVKGIRPRLMPTRSQARPHGRTPYPERPQRPRLSQRDRRAA